MACKIEIRDSGTKPRPGWSGMKVASHCDRKREMKMDMQITAPLDQGLAAMHRRFDLQHALTRGGLAPTLAERRARLDKLRQMLLANEPAFVAAISEDFGNRSADETRLLEIGLVLNAIRYARKHLRSWMRRAPRHVDIAFQPAKSWVRHEPLGVIGIIAPWNYPLFLALGPLVDVLAAGNRAMIKPSELTPRSSDLLARTVAETYDEAEVAVVTGGPEIAQAFLEPAVRPPGLHRLDRRRPQGDAGRRGQPDAGHARARWQVAGDRL
jgi:coniferyl-aldehyde dehydrogenase